MRAAASFIASASSGGHDRDILHSGRCGRYEVLGQVGAGGMGVVFEALDPELARPVAVKVLHSAHGSEGAARMKREGQTMAQLAHPNVIRVYDVGVAHGHAFVAMELVRGSTLGGWLDAAPRTPAEILATFADAGRGLAAAHAAGLVHRDFKPDNVLIGSEGRPRVCDFGLVVDTIVDDREDRPTHRHARLAVVPSLVPRVLEDPDLLSLELVEGHARVLGQQGRRLHVHPLLRRPFGRRPRAGAPPDAVSQTG